VILQGFHNRIQNCCTLTNDRSLFWYLLKVDEKFYQLKTSGQTILTLPMLFNGPDNTQNCPFLLGILTPIQYMVPWQVGPHESAPKRHLGQFIRFCKTDCRPRYSICSNRPHLVVPSMQPKINRDGSSASYLSSEMIQVRRRTTSHGCYGDGMLR